MMSMIRYLAFQMSVVFPEDDPLSEWLITPALAMNDLALVHVRLDEDPEEPDRAFYWNRLAVSHFTEAALFLRDTADVPEVRAFVESLGDEARTKYDECLAIFHEYRGELFSKRNKATFHYRALRPANQQADRPIRVALAALRDDRGVIRSARIRDARPEARARSRRDHFTEQPRSAGRYVQRLMAEEAAQLVRSCLRKNSARSTPRGRARADS